VAAADLRRRAAQVPMVTSDQHLPLKSPGSGESFQSALGWVTGPVGMADWAASMCSLCAQRACTAVAARPVRNGQIRQTREGTEQHQIKRNEERHNVNTRKRCAADALGWRHQIQASGTRPRPARSTSARD
jgi:hypothetical protein